MQREVNSLKKGGVGILPTDTLYGIVASALNEKAVERVYALKGRAPAKPCIILISSLSDLALFGVTLSPALQTILSTYWPGPTSIILPCVGEAFAYLHRGTHSLAFRLPKNDSLRALLQETGPLIAPSANAEGLPPATTIKEAQDYFKDKVDFYMDGGVLNNPPSSLIRISEDGAVEKLR